MRLFRAEGLRAADAAAADAGVPTYDLMLAAGAAVAAALRRHWPSARRVAVLCGPGNNGGDGYVAARVLATAGFAVRVFEWRDPSPGSDAARARAELLDAAVPGADVVRTGDPGATAPPGDADVVVDALFGSGLTRPLEGVAAAWVDAVAATGVPVLAVDVPSGVRADLAGVRGPVVRASVTVQLGGAVIASALAPARSAFGAWEVADIGIPLTVLDTHAAGRLLEPADVAAHVGPPADDLHKYRAGTVLVMGGSRRYAGAAELAARGALRAGAGLVTLAAPDRAPGGWPELVWEPLAAGASGDDVQALLRSVGERRAAATVLGPGWDVSVDTLAAALRAAAGPVVLDAGALAHDLSAVARARRDVTLTPHHGEAAALLAHAREAGHDHLPSDLASWVGDDPVAAAQALAAAWGATVVLKGAGTVIADATGRLALCRAGTPAMATAGTGDVLAGAIAALLAAARDADETERFDRVAAAVMLHATAGEIAGALGRGMVASDLVSALPAARARLGGS